MSENTILELLEAHLWVKGIRGLETRCACGWRTGAMLPPEDLHRDHVAAVIENHTRELCYRAWNQGWEEGALHAVQVRAEIDGIAQAPAKRTPNPYREEARDGR